VRGIILALAAIHFAPLVIVVWLELFDLVDLKDGQYVALILTSLMGTLFLLGLLWCNNE
jgi:hypothetical protein